MPFQVLMPVAPLPDKISFDPEEMALVLSVSDKVFNDLAALDGRHNSTVHLFAMYGERRTAVMERFGAKMEGNIGTTLLTEKEKRWLDPRAYELNELPGLMVESSLGDENKRGQP